MFHDSHGLPRRIRIGQSSLVSQLPQILERLGQRQQNVLGHVRTVLGQQAHLRIQVRVVDNVAREDVAQHGVEVVAQEWEARAVGQDDHAEVRVHPDGVRVGGLPRGWDYSATVRQDHLSLLY